jgi:hypothetical protein
MSVPIFLLFLWIPIMKVGSEVYQNDNLLGAGPVDVNYNIW